MNLKNILEAEITIIYVGEETERSHTQETFLQGFVVYSPKLGIVDFQEIKSKNLKYRSTPEFFIQLYHIQKMFCASKEKKSTAKNF